MGSTSVFQRLILLAIVPLVALTVSAAIHVRQAYIVYQNSTQTLRLMALSVSAGNLIHTLQIERGATAGFLQSKGQKFADVLPGIRTNSDDRLAQFQRSAGDIDTSLLPALGKALADAKGKLDGLAGIRERASKQSLTVPDEVAYYSGTIAHLVEAMSVGIAFNQDASISQRMIAYLSFVRAKESAGQERALVTAAFAADRVDPKQFRGILLRFHHQEAYLNDFRSIAGAAENSALASVMNALAAKDVERMRGILIEKFAEGAFGVEPTEWFKTITAKIDGLHETENLITDTITKEADALVQSSRGALVGALALGGLAILATIVISLWVARGIARPLQEMVGFAERAIAENDFAMKVPERGALEVARTGKAFNQLIDKFRVIIIDTKRSSQQITLAAHDLSTSSRQVSESSLVQSSAAEAVAAAVEESSVSVSETADNARSVASVVESARTDTERALAVMRDTVKNMQAIASLIGLSGKNVKRLDDSSQKIGHIVQVIKEIADQTNLLALNAAIEAARAGEQGRGFAVVADEVRKLAERTTQATGEIASLIGEIKDGVGSTVSSMDEANVQADASLDLVNRTEHALHQIEQGSREVAGNVQNISTALAEQDAAIRQIAASVEKIAQMTEENNSVASANNRTASELDGLSSQLRTAVDAFKV